VLQLEFVSQEAEFDGFVFLMEKVPEMYAAAGLPVPPATPMATPTARPTATTTLTATPTANPIDLGSTVKSVMDSVSDMKAANVNINVVVVTGSNTTYEFLVSVYFLPVLCILIKILSFFNFFLHKVYILCYLHHLGI
jgi:hypothetical protein